MTTTTKKEEAEIPENRISFDYDIENLKKKRKNIHISSIRRQISNAMRLNESIRVNAMTQCL